MGDDAGYMLITDTAFKKLDTIDLAGIGNRRLAKEIKPDYEASSLIYIKRKRHLFLVGSGSLSPYRNNCIILDIENRSRRSVKLDTFYNRLIDAGIKELNIEGVTQIPGGMLLASRGSRGYRKNHLIYTTSNFWDDQTEAPFTISSVGTNTDTSMFQGISGLEYSRLTDRLLLTVSTENTFNAYEDGVIGKSYLWLIKDISNKKNYSGINPYQVIDLHQTDKKLSGHKIESVCILNENNKEMEVVLVSDDDKGGSALFKMKVAYKDK